MLFVYIWHLNRHILTDTLIVGDGSAYGSQDDPCTVKSDDDNDDDDDDADDDNEDYDQGGG